MTKSFYKTWITLAVGLTTIGIAASQSQIYPDIYADGSCNVDYNWENGKWASWYIELQREGGPAIELGVASENSTYIQSGLTALGWGFSHQASDGSYPGTGDAFHSTSLFVEETAHALLALSQYNPVMGGPNYRSYVTSMKPKLLLSAQWLANNATPTNLAYDAPYTHRRYVVAAAFAEVDKLLNTQQFASLADTFASNGLALQWSNGVNPELGGYDVEYQMVGVQMAQHFCDAQPNDPLVPALLSMMEAAATWETTKISMNGAISTVGSTRVGVELNRNGTVKQPEYTMIEADYLWLMNNAPSLLWTTNYSRLIQPYFPASKQVFAQDGAQSVNIPFDLGQASTYQLNDQHYGSQFFQAGLFQANPTLLNQGANITNWGLKQQTSNGLFGPTVAVPYNVAAFVESLGRLNAALQSIQNAGGVLSQQNLAYQTTVQTAIVNAANAINTPSLVALALKEESASTSNLWMFAADMAVAGNLSKSPALLAQADQFASAALKLQLANGENPEGGAVDYSGQAQGMLYAIEYMNNSTNSILVTATGTMLQQAAAFESAAVGSNGNLPTVNNSSPSYYHIANALQQEYSLFGGQKVAVALARINQNHGINQPY